MSAPAPFTVKAPELKLALPAMAGEPISVSLQPEGNPDEGLMVRFTVLECVRRPLVPVMVSVNVPVDAVLKVETLIVDEPEPLSDVGLNIALAPVGTPLTLRFTVPAKQPTALTLPV